MPFHLFKNMKLHKELFKSIDNSPLIVFRIIFGFLIMTECAGAIFTKWVEKTLITPKFTFNFIGFDFLQYLPDNFMYSYFAIMSLMGFLVMIGYKYRYSLGIFTLMWGGVYLMQKTSYNNHYYLLCLLCIIMLFLPAHKYAAIDTIKRPTIKKNTMPQWCAWLIIGQVWIVYTYAAIAKLYPDWLDLSVIELLMSSKKGYPLIGSLLQTRWVHIFLAYSGIVFDFLIVPCLLIKKTRKWAFFASAFFHLFNSIVFQIGIFPYLSLAFSVFFFNPEQIRRFFFKKKPLFIASKIKENHYKRTTIIIIGLYLLIQIILPVRHWFIQDNVLWTEEGHRLSWRMMLRSKKGYISFKVVNRTKDTSYQVNLKEYLTPKQRNNISTKPDLIWQFAQYLKKEHQEKNEDIGVYVTNSKVSVNNGPWLPFVKPGIDLGNEPWHYFKHEAWLYPYKKQEK